MARRLWIAIAAGAWLVPTSAGAVSLVLDRLGTPDVVQVGDTVSFSFAFQFDPDEILLATQAEISAPHLSGFTFEEAGLPWDLAATFRQNGAGNPMWVYAENTYSSDPKGVTWREVNGLAPLGGFSAIATYNGEIVLDLSTWELTLLDNSSIPIDPAWQHLHTGVTIVGGAELPPPPSPPAPLPPPAAPAPPPIASPPPAQAGPPPVRPPSEDVFYSPGERVFFPASLDLSGDVREVFLIGCSDGEACVRRVRRGDLDPTHMVMNVAFGTWQGEAVEAAAPEPRGSVLLALAALLLLVARSTPARAAVSWLP